MTKFLESKDREIRKEAFEKMLDKRLSLKKDIDDIFTSMTKLRNESAINAGFNNYTELRFKELERFDYTPKECYDFHTSILDVCTPIFGKIIDEKKRKLGVNKMMPYDMNATMPDDDQLKPFENTAELIEKSREVFSRIDKRFVDVFDRVNKANHLDLDSRKGKAPGGYNYPLYKSGLP
ncbi:MAG: oligoendopeptidase F, partial [bacterium (Candidatus Stahlbacteria) CG23_combo_of_CG06-09_8_20_14_all_34_7]